MPISLSTCILHTSSRRFKLTVLLLLSPLIFYAQTLTGLWIGAVSNDSTTVRKDQSFEIALTEYKGKVYGYSRSEFIVDDVLYYVVKRVKGKIEGDVCEVVDDEIIAFNFPTKLDKGVKVTSLFRRNQTDSTWYLDGTWKTNKTKNYYAVTGKISLAEEKDLTASKIFPHLEELKVADEIAFYKERNEGAPIAKLAKPERDNMASLVNPKFEQGEVNISASTPNVSLNKVEPEPAPEEPIKAVSSTYTPTSTVAISDKSDELKTKQGRPVATKSAANVPLNTVAVVQTQPQPEVNGSVVSSNNNPQTTDPKPGSTSVTNQNNTNPTNNQETITNKDLASNTKPSTSQPSTLNPQQYVPDYSEDIVVARPKPVQNTPPPPVINKTVNDQTRTAVAVKNDKKDEPVVVKPIPKVNSTVAQRNGAAAEVNDRRTEVTQVVNFVGDSLVLSLYDNGQIDGDTVSVLMNGEVILSKQCLKATAIRHIVRLPAGKEEFHLVLYAENLGEYPPNTGLLTVRDGEDVYNLRFSADFQKNTGIIFRKKK